MRLADGVTITGDVTISDDLVLSKISDDGNAITMTNDGSSRTITGSGSIEASTLAATPQYQSLTGMTGDIGSAVTGGAGLSVTGMTGELGSAVTGSPNLNLGNTTGILGSGVTFPAGHILQVKSDTSVSASMDISTTASRPYGTDLQVGITAATSNYLLVNVFIAGYWNFTSSAHSLHAGFQYSTDNWNTPITLGPRVFPLSHFGYLNATTAFLADVSFSTWAQVPTASAMKIQIYCLSTTGTVRIHANQSSDTAVGREASCLTVMEVQG